MACGEAELSGFHPDDHSEECPFKWLEGFADGSLCSGVGWGIDGFIGGSAGERAG